MKPSSEELAVADLGFHQFMNELDELAEQGRRSYNYRQVADAVLFGVRMRVLYELGKPDVYFTPIESLGLPPKCRSCHFEM